MSESITYDALEQNKEELFIGEKRKRGRPPKSFLSSDEINVTESKPTSNNAAFLVAYPQRPKDDFGKWQKIHVTETSEVFLKWLDDCQFGAYEYDLKYRKYSKFIWIVSEDKSKKQRAFAFIDRATGNIHNPVKFDEPFDHFVGNIIDPKTRISTIGPYGVKTEWKWLPTHPEYAPIK